MSIPLISTLKEKKHKPERDLRLSIFRLNPDDPDDKPKMQDFVIKEFPGMTLFQALSVVRDTLDPSVRFDFVCRASVCGSCAMLINGRPLLACRTQTADLPSTIRMMPLPVFRLLGDLSVDTGDWFRDLNIRTESWIHNHHEFQESSLEERMTNTKALEIYQADRCIECGICIAACATANIHADFLGAAGLNRIARFVMDPRDQRSDQEYFEVLGTEDGVFGCVGLMACNDFCPKSIPLQGQLAYIRRFMTKAVTTKTAGATSLPTIPSVR